jgi:hypothetical protein
MRFVQRLDELDFFDRRVYPAKSFFFVESGEGVKVIILQNRIIANFREVEQRRFEIIEFGIQLVFSIGL